MKKIWMIAVLVVVLVSLSACAAGPNEMVAQPSPDGEVAGFWLGLWHGFISFFTFIVSLFNDNVNVYEVYNNGGWYNFGFILGVSMFFGGGGNRTRTRTKVVYRDR